MERRGWGLSLRCVCNFRLVMRGEPDDVRANGQHRPKNTDLMLQNNRHFIKGDYSPALIGSQANVT